MRCNGGPGGGAQSIGEESWGGAGRYNGALGPINCGGLYPRPNFTWQQLNLPWMERTINLIQVGHLYTLDRIAPLMTDPTPANYTTATTTHPTKSLSVFLFV